MKVTVRLEVSDQIRKAIGTQFAPVHLTADRLLKKAPLVDWLQKRISLSLPGLANFAPPPKVRSLLVLPEADRAQLRRVYEHFRERGLSDGQIEEWILMQRARLELARLFPHVNGAPNGKTP